MAAEYFNSLGGFSTGIPQRVVIDANGNVVSNFNNLAGNVSANKIYANAFYFANGNPFNSSPGGTNLQLQFNNNGQFGGIQNTSYDGNVLHLGNISELSIGGGLNGYYLQTDGLGGLTWGPGGNGGSGNGIPGGANTQVQFNDENNFGGNAGFTFNKDSGTLHVTSGVTTNVVTASTFIGNGAQLTGISVNSANYVSASNQANITSLGNLTSLGVIGNTTVGNLIGPHANGNSNINIPVVNGNVNISAAGNANILVVTGTGAVISTGTFIAGTANVTSGANITPIATKGQYNITALAVNANILAPSGTAYDGQKLMIRIKDDGTTRNLTWTTTSGGYRVIGTTLPTSTTASKTTYVGCIYNSTDTFWDVVVVTTQA